MKKKKSDHLISAYVIKGSALDVLGKTKESIKLFEKGIKRTEGHYLLHFNLAINHYKIKNYKEAEEQALKALEFNPSHSSSHLMLANINQQNYKMVPAILSAHYFLLLEPQTNRSSEAFEILTSNLGGNVEKVDDRNTNITLNLGGDDRFRSTELLISLSMANMITEDVDKDSAFYELNKMIFNTLGEQASEIKDIYQSMYIPFFYELAQSDHLETYLKYIQSGVKEEASEWIQNNEAALNAFASWLEQ